MEPTITYYMITKDHIATDTYNIVLHIKQLYSLVLLCHT